MSEVHTHLSSANHSVPAPPVLARCWIRLQETPCLDGNDGFPRCAMADIAVEDWDVLFRAALEQLAHLSSHPMPCNTAMHECLEALDQLRRSVPLHCIAAALQPQARHRI